MAINKKLIHFKNKENFEREVANGNILDNSIVFIQDTKEIWTHGTIYCVDKWNSVLTDSGEGIKYLSDDGSYKEIIVPTKISELINDSGFVSSEIVQQLIDDSIANLDIGDSSGGETDVEVSVKGGTVLYEVTTDNANFSDITLSQSSSNFTQLDICCCTDVRETIFISVYNPNRSIFNVSSSIQESGELIIKSKQYEINDSTIMSVLGLGGMVSVSSNGIATVDGNYIGIYKVIGYGN